MEQVRLAHRRQVLWLPYNFCAPRATSILPACHRRSGSGIFSSPRARAIDQQTVIRLNRDTLYSPGVFDLDAGPVTITLPDAGKRFMSMQVINEDQYTPEVVYGAGTTR